MLRNMKTTLGACVLALAAATGVTAQEEIRVNAEVVDVAPMERELTVEFDETGAVQTFELTPDVEISIEGEFLALEEETLSDIEPGDDLQLIFTEDEGYKRLLRFLRNPTPAPAVEWYLIEGEVVEVDDANGIVSVRRDDTGLVQPFAVDADTEIEFEGAIRADQAEALRNVEVGDDVELRLAMHNDTERLIRITHYHVVPVPAVPAPTTTVPVDNDREPVTTDVATDVEVTELPATSTPLWAFGLMAGLGLMTLAGTMRYAAVRSR